MIFNLIDTNIVFDIIYSKRDRNSLAINFYKEFKNFELKISDVVKKECMKVLIKYTVEFSTDFNNFLGGQNSLGKHWDNMDTNSRSNFINDFVKGIKNKSNYKEIIPFYENLIKRIKKSVIFIDTENINKYLLELSSAMQEYFLDSLNMMFSTVIPNKNSLDFTKNYKKFHDLLRDYFNEKQSSDFEILINLILLVIFGNMENNTVDLINFYSCDKKFIKNFNTICKNKDTIFEVYQINIFWI